MNYAVFEVFLLVFVMVKSYSCAFVAMQQLCVRNSDELR